jgi:malate dehydrogenase (oxaloacetate-decarboxylating)
MQGRSFQMHISICKYRAQNQHHEKVFISNSEDFGLRNARRLLDQYRPQIPCFNDDVQGTGCVTLAALMAGMHVSNIHITDVRVVIFGSGTAGTGIADQICDAIATEGNKPKQEAAKHIW